MKSLAIFVPSLLTSQVSILRLKSSPITEGAGRDVSSGETHQNYRLAIVLPPEHKVAHCLPIATLGSLLLLAAETLAALD